MFCLFLFSFCFAENEPHGSLIVTYELDSDEIKLDQVRFWLINESQHRLLYPKKNRFIEDEEKKERKVVIDNLPIGEYVLEFIVPNVNGKLEEPLKKSIYIGTNDITKIDYIIKPKFENKEILAGPVLINPYPVYPPPVLLPPRRLVPVSIDTNIPSAAWRILHQGNIVYEGVGSIDRLRLPEGKNYVFNAVQIPGYTMRISPSDIFDLSANNEVRILVFYQLDVGFINVETDFPNNERLGIILVPRDNRPQIQFVLQPVNGKISWKSTPIPVGYYMVNFQLPKNFIPVEPIEIQVYKGSSSVITPQFIQTASLEIETNIDDAIFTLTSIEGQNSFTGKGKNFVFTKLIPGKYVLNFTSSQPEMFIPPKTQNILITNDVNTFEAVYKQTGKLTLEGNLPFFSATIIGEDSEPIHIDVPNHSKPLILPIGSYRVIFESIPDSNEKPPSPVDIDVYPYYSQKLYANYTPAAEKGPEEKTEKVKPTEEKTVPVEKKEINYPFVNVPAGIVILGDPFEDSPMNVRKSKILELDAFAIAVYEVTNALFAQWLTNATQEEKLHIDEKGIVRDKEGNPICKTMKANPLSQILFEMTTKGISFFSVPGKEQHPVIEVTWFGAERFCKDHGFRLPSEAEWEKAAGMAISEEGQPPKKFRYGFSRDTIDRTWANYRTSELPLKSLQVLTTPVGFYNGINLLALQPNDRTQLTTNNALSPVGAYDMSGNVWEWVAEKVLKGGCYDSTADGVRVAERLESPPEHSDIFTGFRPVKSPENSPSGNP